MGYLKSIGTAFIYTALLLAVITFLPGLPPDATFLEYSITPPTKLSGKLDINNRLNEIEFLHIGKLKGPESFDSYNGELYTGLHGGYVVKIDEKGIIPFVKFGGKCDGILQYYECGKVLGIKFDKKGNLYVIDTYLGIFKVDPSGNYQKIIDISKPIANKIPKIPNGLDVAENGDIFWTDSSTDFPLYDGIFSMFANPSGRLIRYNVATKTNEVLLENLAFANGVRLSKDESFLIVLETLASRIIKYNLKGAKAGQQEILLEGLPGLPDNINDDNHGGFLISLYTYIDQEHPQLIQTLMPHPYLRKMLARLFTLIEAPFKLMQSVYPNFYVERIIHAIGSFETLNFMMVPISVVLQLDSTGKLVDAAYLTDQTSSLSSGFIHKGYLWIGSPHNEYVARVSLKQAFPHLAQTEKLMHHSNLQDTKERPKTYSTTIKSPTVETAKPITKTAGNTDTSTLTGTSPKTSTKQEKMATPKLSTSVPSTTVKPSTTSVPSTTIKPNTTSVPSTTIKPSKTSVSSTNVKPSTTSVPSTTVEPNTVSKTTPTPKVTTATTKPATKLNTETIPKSNNKEIKSETVKNKVISDVKSENIKETNSKSKVNKQTVQNTQFKAQNQEHQSNESPEINNNDIPK